MITDYENKMLQDGTRSHKGAEQCVMCRGYNDLCIFIAARGQVCPECMVTVSREIEEDAKMAAMGILI